MKRLVVMIAIGTGFGAFGALACGGGDKPPLTPDTEHTAPADVADAGATTPPAAAPTSPPSK